MNKKLRTKKLSIHRDYKKSMKFVPCASFSMMSKIPIMEGQRIHEANIYIWEENNQQH